MPDRNDHTLKELIAQLIRAYRWDDNLDLVRLQKSWEKIVGKVIAGHTQHLSVKKRVLHIQLDSSVIRNELLMARSKLVRMINEEMGTEMIDDIVLR